MKLIIALLLSFSLRTAPERRAVVHVSCWDTAGHRVEFVVFTPPAVNQAQFCLDRGLLPFPPGYRTPNSAARHWRGHR